MRTLLCVERLGVPRPPEFARTGAHWPAVRPRRIRRASRWSPRRRSWWRWQYSAHTLAPDSQSGYPNGRSEHCSPVQTDSLSLRVVRRDRRHRARGGGNADSAAVAIVPARGHSGNSAAAWQSIRLP